jgi:hypothetical protein
LSELKFSSTEIKNWLENETSSTLTPVHAQAQKLRDETRAALQSLSDASKMLLDNSAREIEKRNMRIYNRARALNKLARLFLDRLKKLNAPDQVSYDSLNRFAQDAQKVFTVIEIDIKNWFPRISPFFIMDRRKFLVFYEKAKLTLAALNDFLNREYVKTKTLEETFQLINELHALEKQLSEVAAQREDLKNERLPIEKEIAELEQKIVELKSKGPVDQLFGVEAETEALNSELKHKLRHLQKPFIKMQALAFQGGGAGLTPDELSKLSQYLEKPFKALATEEVGYPVLKQILQKLARLMAEDRLKLKADKARKAEQILSEILQRDVLAGIYARCADLAARERQLLNSAKLDEVRGNISMFQEQVGHHKARKISVEAHEAIKEQEYNAVMDRIRGHKNAIEKNVYSSLSKQVQIL